VVIRRAGPADLEAAVAVWAAANERPPVGGHADRLRTWFAQDGAQLLVAIDDEELVIGTVLSLPGRDADGAGEVVAGWRHITGVAVLPEHQRSGVGRALVTRAIAEARAGGTTRLTLWVRSDNTGAVRLFESVGFERTGRTERDDEGAEVALLELSDDSRAIP
jgi:ribosomal protein S18 acetylase RimI-like enzyme